LLAEKKKMGKKGEGRRKRELAEFDQQLFLREKKGSNERVPPWTRKENLRKFTELCLFTAV